MTERATGAAPVPVAPYVLGELVTHAQRNPELRVIDASGTPDVASRLHGIPDHQVMSGGDTVRSGLHQASESARAHGRAVVIGPSHTIASDGYAVLREEIARPSLPVSVLALDAGLPPDGGAHGPVVFDDVGLLRAIPGCSVYAPADAPSAGAALNAALQHAGPVYLRLPPGAWPSVSRGDFEPGHAPVAHDGRDLTIAALGPLLGQALKVAGQLQAVGVGARVLDCGSVKPLDEKVLIRAARETGAILTLEDHTPSTGLGSAIAAVVALEASVPVRPLGIPDIFLELPTNEHPWEAVGLGVQAVIDEAWELLRLRGKVQ